jgi:hypothetical protein
MDVVEQLLALLGEAQDLDADTDDRGPLRARLYDLRGAITRMLLASDDPRRLP